MLSRIKSLLSGLLLRLRARANRVLHRLLFGLALVSFSACATPCPPPLPEVVRARPACLRPQRPSFEEIAGTERDKWGAMLDNIASQSAYAAELEAALDCYEESTKDKNE